MTVFQPSGRADKVKVPISLVNTLLGAYAQQGYNVDELLDSLGISSKLIKQSTEFSALLYGRLYQRVLLDVKDESFGMASGGRIPNGAFRMLCLCILHARDLENALMRSSDFYEICRGPKIKPITIKNQNVVTIWMGPVEYLGQDAALDVMQRVDELGLCHSLSMWRNFISWLIGQRLVLTEVHMPFAEPKDGTLYRQLFQDVPIYFNQEKAAIFFDQHFLSLPIVQTETSLNGFLKTAPYQLLVMNEEKDSLSGKVTAIVGHDFSRQIPSADTVANQLNLSVATLRRKLTEEGTSFQQIKDQARENAAIHYLNSSLSLTEISLLLGFSELSAFHRSFKRWTGMTATQFRRALRENATSPRSS